MFNRIAVEADRLGLQIAVHCCGDGAVQRTLDGIELAQRQNGTENRRHRIEHIETIAPADIPRFAHLGVIASMQPFTSLESALAQGDFAAVDIMLPHNQHEAAALAAFAAGKHGVLEKPMSTNIASCDRILAAAKQAGTVFMVAEQAQYWPDVRKVQELIHASAIGEIITARLLWQPSTGPQLWSSIASG